MDRVMDDGAPTVGRTRRWGWLSSFAVRTAILFVACFPFWMNPLGWTMAPFHRALQGGTGWLHDHVFRVVGLDLSRLADPDVGNKVEMALAGGLLWLLLDRRRRREDALYEVLCVETRCVLGGVMISFGLIKVFAIQMWPPSSLDLMQPLGQPDVMASAWGLTARTVGASTLYQMYTGWLELTSGLMLFFRRTATLGTLIVLVELAAVIVTCSDTVDVTNRNHFNWLAGAPFLVALILASTVWRPVVDFFVLNRPTAPVMRPASPCLHRFEVVLQVFFVVATLYFSLYRHTIRAWLDRGVHSPISGVYEVERFTRDGQSYFTGADAGQRWRRVAIDDCRRFAVRTVDDVPLEFTIVFPVKAYARFHRDCAAATAGDQGTLTLKGPDRTARFGVARGEPPPSPNVLHYVRSKTDQLDLEGELEGAKITAHLRRLPSDRFGLIRGFAR